MSSLKPSSTSHAQELKNILTDPIYDQLDLHNWEIEGVDFQDMDDDVQARAVNQLMHIKDDSFVDYIDEGFDMLFSLYLSGFAKADTLASYMRDRVVECYTPHLCLLTTEIAQEIIDAYIEDNKAGI